MLVAVGANRGRTVRGRSRGGCAKAVGARREAWSWKTPLRWARRVEEEGRMTHMNWCSSGNNNGDVGSGQSVPLDPRTFRQGLHRCAQS